MPIPGPVRSPVGELKGHERSAHAWRCPAWAERTGAEEALAPQTLATLALGRLGVAYSLHAYPADESHLDAVTVAEAVGLVPSQVFKTLVTMTDTGRVLVASLPADRELDLKKLARAAGAKRAELVPVKDLFRLTGYVRGGVSPLGLRRPYPVFIADEIEGLDPVSVSAGRRGLQIFLAGDDLVRACQARVVTLLHTG